MGIFDFLKKKKSLFDLVSGKLEADFAEAKFSEDWKRGQEIKVKLEWLTFIKNQGSPWKEYIPEYYKDSSSSEDLNKLTIDEIKFPNELNAREVLHYKFAEKIIQDYGRVLANPGKYQNCFYKPGSLLPYPKDYIRKAIMFTEHCLNTEKPLFSLPENKDEIINKLGGIDALLENFVNASEKQLSTDANENMMAGSQLAE